MAPHIVTTIIFFIVAGVTVAATAALGAFINNRILNRRTRRSMVAVRTRNNASRPAPPKSF